MTTHNLADVLAEGYTEIDAVPHATLSLGYLIKQKAHCAFRLDDGLWHYFRFSDVTKAKEMDAAMRGPLL